MRRLTIQLVVTVVLAVGAAAAACALLPAAGLFLNPVPTVLGAAVLAVGGWTLYHTLDGTGSVIWPIPNQPGAVSSNVRERGIAKTMNMLTSAEAGSSLSADDVVAAVVGVAARQLVLHGADPNDPFEHADGVYSRDLVTLCRRSRAGEPTPRLSRRRLDAYLKEILAR